MAEKKKTGKKAETAEKKGKAVKEEPKPEKKAKPVEKKETKKAQKGEGKAKPKKGYRISRSPEARKRAREKSRLEKKKGKFKRQNLGKKKRIKDRWRRPRGIDSGHRIDEKHKPAHPRAGYMTPKSIKGLHPSGYEPVRVFNLSELENLEPKTQAAVIASSVGKRKRAELQKAAQEKGIQVLNHKG